MATDARSIVLTVALVGLLVAGLYLIDPTLFGLLGSKEGFDATLPAGGNGAMGPSQGGMPGAPQANAVKANPNSAGGDAHTAGLPGVAMAGFMDASGMPMMDASGAKAGFYGGAAEGFADVEDVTGPAEFASAQGPAGCYPRDQLTPSELLPKDQGSVWAQQNPMGSGSLKGKNFLSAGALIGVNTVGQSMRNANYQLRSEPPNPQVPVSVFYNSTIEPDTNRRDLEIN